ncbi:MAG TPA: hypothetical protein VFK32_07540 [Tepidiformaceae bacterium]|nr:hypothetical protein [Tepidiformaceae bacterium]
MNALRWTAHTTWVVARAAIALAFVSLFAPARRATINRRTGQVRLI